ncbi:hypothetical protein M758_3G250300 [Ceratodon purpureus]|nr:hypothetical protein M758_3G250300 [Ceratodon purpureus]
MDCIVLASGRSFPGHCHQRRYGDFLRRRACWRIVWMNGGLERVGVGMESSLVVSSLRKAMSRGFEVRGRLEGAGGGEVERGKAGKEGMVRKILSVRTLAVALFFGGVAGLCRALVSCLPPDFFDRWKRLVNDQPLQEPKPVEQEGQPATVIYDCHGVVLARIVQGGNYSSVKGESQAGKSKRTGDGAPLHPSDIPSALWQAVVASEDRRFFEHQGIDPRGLTRAILSLAASGGGSTITQQLVKNVFLSNDRKWSRKLIEMILAVFLERQMSKWDILHHYLNKIYWGHGVYGIEAAAALYFGKHPSALTLGECAMLAGIIPAPEYLSPYRDPSRGKKPQARTLRRMVEAGFLDSATAAAAVNEPLRLGVEGDDGSSGPWKAPYFVSEVLYELYQKYGRDEVLQGGYQVHTTVDLEMQEIAEKAVNDAGIEYDDERIMLAEKAIERCVEALGILEQAREQKMEQAALVAGTRAREQFRKYAMREAGKRKEITEEDRIKLEELAVSVAVNKATDGVKRRFDATEDGLRQDLAEHQEEIKKAAAARVEGAMVAIDPMSGGVRVLVGGRDYYESNFNRATQAFRPPGSTFKPIVYLTALAEGIERNHVLMDEPYTVGDFSPENYDKKFRGKVTLEEALLKSLNVPTVRLCAEIGVDKVCRMGRALGIDSYLPHELSLSLGGCELTPLQLTFAYSTIAAGGVLHKPYLISRVENHEGRIIEEKTISADQHEPVVNEYAVSELRSLLQAVVDRGTGRGARIGRPCAGKTGTSDGHRDAWFAGFTPMLSCVVWLGYDDNTPLGGIWPATGSSHAAPLWRDFMMRVHEGLPVEKFHDIGRDMHGGGAPRQIGKKSRRAHIVGIPEIRKQYRQRDKKVLWRDVWDWEKASSAWEERERMEEWTAERAKRAEGIKTMKTEWQKTLAKTGISSS